MARLIDAEAYLAKLVRMKMDCIGREDWEAASVIDDCMCELDAQRDVESDALGAYKQCAWERDIAIEQLRTIGLSLGAKANDVVRVVRCKDCKYREEDFGNGAFCNHIASGLFGDIVADDYCSCGERKDDA